MFANFIITTIFELFFENAPRNGCDGKKPQKNFWDLLILPDLIMYKLDFVKKFNSEFVFTWLSML